MRVPALSRLFLITSLIVLLAFAQTATAQCGSLGQTSMGQALSDTTNEELAGLLASRDEQASVDAAWETFRRGERMIPLLFRLEGDQRLFAGAGYLASPIGGQLVFSREDAPPDLKVTVEVAALFLVNAIYFEKFHFAQSPYLTDRKLPVDQRRTANTKKLVSRGWQSAKRWLELLKKEGLESLRARKLGPLSEGEVAFW